MDQLPIKPNPSPNAVSWSQAMNRVLWGLLPGAFTLNFWGLDHILPAVGVVLLLLGLRPLRREGYAFRLWWYTALVWTGLWGFQTLHRAVPGWRNFNQTPLGLALTATALVMGIVRYFCLWRGLQTAQRAVGLEPRAGGAIVLLVWQVLLTGMALAGLSQIGPLMFLILLAVILCAFWSLFKRVQEVGEAGYMLHPVPLRVGDGPLTGLILGPVLLGVLAVSLTCGRLPMDWQTADQTESVQSGALRAQLLELGFPAQVLADLSQEDLLACIDPVRVVSETDSFSLYTSVKAQDSKPLTITSVGVELAGARVRWRVFHHFQWEEGVSFYGADGMQFWPAYHLSEGWAKSGQASGRVLCTQGGEALWAPYHFLGEETYTSDSIFFGARTSTDLFASFSFPRNGEHCRGYVSYETAENREGYLMDSWINYAHARNPIQYPAITGREWIQSQGVSTDSEPFFYIQTALQFYPWQE